MKICAQWTNAHGGTNGHPVQMVTIDDNGNAATSLAAATKLIQEDHVGAIVGENTAQRRVKMRLTGYNPAPMCVPPGPSGSALQVVRG
jgi:ABC-type branched-subunit amino acid transport system substrate-binding protein